MENQPATAARPAQRRRFRLGLFRRENGQSLVELSFVLPIFLVLVVGVVEVADAMNSYITIIDAARDGARLGSKNLATDDEIRNLVAVETNRLRDPPVIPDDVDITYGQFNGVNKITVEVCTDRELIMSIPIVMPDSFEMCSETTMRVLPGGGS
jgi:hypothetical protein